MGSLMSGWDSPVREKFMRSKSLTRDEIAAFWKSKKLKEEEEHLRDNQKVAVAHGDEQGERNADRLMMSQSLEEKLLEKHGWWISSKWAFLNQPPVLKPEPQGHEMMKKNKYVAASQFYVAS